MSENPLAKLGELSKPATVLIQKVSRGIGAVFEPYQIRRLARAKADADKIEAQSQIELSELKQRALHRILEEEVKHQANMDTIIAGAIPDLKGDANPELMEDDWVTNFFDKSRLISDVDMQSVWSKLLAGEANAPGAYSRKTVNLLGDIEKSDAQLFMSLARCCWTIGSIYPLVFSSIDAIYNSIGINFKTLAQLENLGLIRFDDSLGFSATYSGRRLSTSYFGQELILELPQDLENQLRLGHVLFTRSGEELVRICQVTPLQGFFEYVKDQWKSSLS